MSYEPHASQQAAYSAPQAQQYQAEAYQAQAYQQAAAKPALPTTLAYTNTFALLAIVFAFIMPIAAIVFGHLGLGQIKRNGDSGRGIALTGLIIGYASIAIVALMIIAYIGMIAVMIAGLGAAMSGIESSGSFS